MNTSLLDLPELSHSEYSTPRSIAEILPSVLARYGLPAEIDSATEPHNRFVVLGNLQGATYSTSPSLVTH